MKYFSLPLVGLLGLLLGVAGGVKAEAVPLDNSLVGSYLSFSEVYLLALENDHKTRASELRALSHKFRIEQARANLLPTVNLTGSYARNNFSYNPKFNRDDVEQDLFSLGVNLNLSVYDPRNFNNIKIEEFRGKLSGHRLSLQQAALAQDSLKAYLEVIRNYNRIKILASRLKLGGAKLEMAEKQYALNLGSRVEVLQAQIDYDGVKIELRKQQNNLALAKSKLQKFIGAVNFKVPTLKSAENDSVALVGKMSRHLQQLADQIGSNPNIKYSQDNLLLSREQVERAKSDRLPKVWLAVSYDWYDTVSPNSQSSYDNRSSISINFSQPLYAGGRYRAQIREANLLKQSAFEDFEETKKQVQIQWYEAFTQFDNAVDLLPMYLRSIVAAELYAKEQQKKFEHGLSSIIEVNFAAHKLYEVKQLYLDNLTNVIAIYVVMLATVNSLDDLGRIDALFVARNE